MTTSTEILGKILFTDPVSALVTELLVCRDPETELMLAVEADGLPENMTIYSPFMEDTKLKLKDAEAMKKVIPAFVMNDDLESVEEIDDRDNTGNSDDDDADFA